MHRPIFVDGKKILTDAKGIIKVEKCIDEIVEVMLNPTLTCCTSKTVKIKVTGKETVRLLALAKVSGK